MVATIAAGTSAQYYTETTEYYVGGREPAGRWILTAGGLLLSVGSIVESKPFELLHAGLRPDGSALLSTVGVGGPRRRIGGYDATFSAPKSFALLWAMADDDFRARLEDAQAKAVAQAIEIAEKYAAFCRFGRNGVHREKTRLTVASFQHGESRPAEHTDGRVFEDPNLHTHTVIINAGPRQNGGFGALDGTALFAWKMAMGAQYHAVLAFELMRLGFKIELTGKNGLFEIRGVPADLIKYFSARRNEIADELAAIGMQSMDAPSVAASVARKSRKIKQQHQAEDRHVGWRDRVTEQGYDATTLIATSLAQPEHKESLADRLAQIAGALTEHESTFERRNLHAAVASAYVGTGEDPRHVAAEVDRMIAEGEYVVLDRDRFGQEILTTPEMLRIEREIGQMVRELTAIPGAALDAGRVDELVTEHGLNDEQAAAARATLTAQVIHIIEGAPGSGKTKLLEAVTEALQETGHRVIAGATAWRVANALRNDLAIKARAIDSWLAVARTGGDFITAGTVLIVDEAGLLSSRQMHALLRAFSEAQANGDSSSRLILVGDRDQLQSVGAGSGLRLVANAMSGSKVDEIVRQHEQWARDAITHFGKGRAREALAAYRERGLVLEADGAAATVKALVDAWEQTRVGAGNGSALIIAKSNAQVRAISTEVRRRLRDRGQIVGAELLLPAVSASHQEVTLPLAQGDRVRFLTRAMLDGGEIVNGTEGRIESIRSGTRVELTVATQNGRVRFSPDEIADEQGRAKLAHAYASTIHLAQGTTVDQAVVWVTPGMDRHDIYVSASRARAQTQLVIDRRAVETSLKASLPLSERRRGEAKEFDERLDFLATQLARARLKRTTQDFAPQMEPQVPLPLLSASREQAQQDDARKRVQVREISLD